MKRKLLLLCLALALAACSGNNETSDNNGSADMAADVSTAQDTGNNGGDDMGNPSDMPATVDMGTEDAAADMPGDEDMSMDMFMAPDVSMDPCAHPTTDPSCPMGEFGAGTFLDSIVIVEDTSCCRDFTGDGAFDNKIGYYMTLLQGVGEDVNVNIATAISRGELAYLFEYANWSNEVYDGDLDMRVFLGSDTDLDFADNLVGTGSFNIRPDSFDMNGMPRWDFQDVTVVNGHLVATGGQLNLFFPYLLDEVQMLMTDVRIEADVTPPADLASGGGVTLANGEISGALDRGLFYDSMNEASNACACLQKNVFTFDAAGDKYECEIDMTDEQACANDPSSGCRFLATRTACQFLELASGDVDVDTTGDGQPDSFSVGVQFTGVPTGIAGRE